MILMEAKGTCEKPARLAIVSQRVSRHVAYREIFFLHRLEASMRKVAGPSLLDFTLQSKY